MISLTAIVSSAAQRNVIKSCKLRYTQYQVNCAIQYLSILSCITRADLGHVLDNDKNFKSISFIYYIAESVFAIRLVNLRSVTCYTDQNF